MVSRMPGLRNRELRCLRVLEAHLHSIGAQPVLMPGAEPPDAFLLLRGDRLAVEVTSIHGHTDLGGSTISWLNVTATLVPFIESLCKELEHGGRVRGTYAVFVPAIAGIKNHRKDILNGLDRILSAWPDTPASSPPARLSVGGVEILVWMLDRQGTAVAGIAGLERALISHRDDQLTGLLQAALTTKAGKLRNVSQPWILVIEDCYGFQRTAGEWQKALGDQADAFQAVVRVRQDEVTVLSGSLSAS